MNPNEIWQAEVNGQIYDAPFSELAAWIGDNALLPGDKVRRGNLRWLEAGKVPALVPFFNAKENGTEPPAIPVSVSEGENPAEENVQIQTENFAPEFDESVFEDSQEFQNENFGLVETPEIQFCLIHTDAKARFVCEICFSHFCKACPQDFGSVGKICPMCGANCKPFVQPEIVQPEEFYEAEQNFYLESPGKFDFGDFGKALSYPFRYKSSLFFGGLMFMFFTIGQQAFAIGGIIMIFAAIFSLMLSNMLTFGILANTVENFSQWKINTNFMPDFDDFSLWDDVVHPFFLSIGAYLVSFGLFGAIVIGGIWYAASSFSGEIEKMQAQSNETPMPGKGGDMEMLKKSPQFKELDERIKQNAQSGIPNAANDEEREFQELQELINESRRAQLESVTGPSPEQEQAQMRELVMSLLKMAIPLVILAGIAFIWGLFYFPAACAVAGYTRSFTATINPSVGMDTIKRLGADYFKILLMSFLIFVMSGVLGGIINLIFMPFAMPRVGNIPAIAAGSFVTFYFWIVFSCVLGYAIYKNSDKLGIYRG